MKLHVDQLTERHPRIFATTFIKLALTKKDHTDRVADENLQGEYFQVLSGLPIDAVIQAAEHIKRAPERFLPSAGEWYTLADEIACEAQVEGPHAPALPAPRDPVDEEQTRIQTAREQFFERWATAAGGTLAADHPLRTAPPMIPTYACLTCRDVGWVEVPDEKATRIAGHPVLCAKHCICWAHNPTLLHRRASTALKQKRQHGRPRS
jgi:hypothetical protein